MSRATKALPARKAPKGLKALPVKRGPLDHKVLRVPKDHRVIGDLRGLKGRKATPGTVVLKA